MEVLHVAMIVIGAIASLVALYASYRLLQFKDEFKTEIGGTIKETCASSDSFDAHEQEDIRRFESVEAAAHRRHEEMRQDIHAVATRVDGLMNHGRG